MFTLKPVLVVAFFVMFFEISLQITDISSRKVEWTRVFQSEAYAVVLATQTPAGIQENHLNYLCRAENEGDNRPIKFYSGMLAFYYREMRCDIAVEGNAESNPDFEILVSPLGSTSWIPFGGDLPLDAVAAFHDNVTNSKSYVCRASNNGSIISGTLGSDNICYIVGNSGDVESVSDKSDIEILAVNKLGRALGVMQVLY